MTTIAPPPVKAEDQAAVQELVQRLTAAWKAQEPGNLSSVYTDDVSMIMPGTHLKGRASTEEFMKQAFATRWKGTEVLGIPLELRYLSDDVLMLISQGGAYTPGAKEVSESDAILGIWLFVKRDSRWIISAYANTPNRVPIPLPG